MIIIGIILLVVFLSVVKVEKILLKDFENADIFIYENHTSIILKNGREFVGFNLQWEEILRCVENKKVDKVTSQKLYLLESEYVRANK